MNITMANGCQRVYTEQDALCEYGEKRILPLYKVSYMNLFINAVLQPIANYTVGEGKIRLHTEDITNRVIISTFFRESPLEGLLHGPFGVEAPLGLYYSMTI